MRAAEVHGRAGMIFDLQRFSLHDGPGIRTTVFLKGCPLRCVWCHNPESISPRPEVSFVPQRCIGCGYCFRVCPTGAHRMGVDRSGDRPQQSHMLDRTVCERCGLCTRECYAQALEYVGREATVDEVIGEVLRDQPFYAHSGGGMTLSGGEPLFQPAFAAALLEAAQREHIHCCVETSGHAPWGHVERLRPFVDLWLYDIKETDPERHVEHTGVSNERVLGNLRALHEAGAGILLRCPIVPGLNDRPDHFEGIARLCNELPRVEGVELLPYHPLGDSKRDRFGIDPAQRTHRATPDPSGH